MSTALRLLLTLGAVAAVLIVLLGPRWRGQFYKSWLRPRLIAFGLLLATMVIGLYIVRVVNALRTH